MDFSQWGRFPGAFRIRLVGVQYLTDAQLCEAKVRRRRHSACCEKAGESTVERNCAYSCIKVG